MQEDFQRTGEDEDEFLTVVLGILQRGVRVGRRGSRHDEGLAGAVLHADRLVQIGELGTTDEGESLAAARDRVEREVRGFAANDGGHVHAEVLGEVVVERERCLLGAAFVRGVFFGGHAQKFRHLFDGEILLSPELADSHGDHFFVVHVLRSLCVWVFMRIAQERTGIRIRVVTRNRTTRIFPSQRVNGWSA